MIGRRAFLQSCATGVALAATQNRAASDPLQLTLVEASDAIRRRTLSPVELTKACLTRIEQINPRLNAFITVTGDSALEQARTAEAEIHKGHWRGPLHGMPIALKDLLDTAGVRTTAASGVFKDRIPDEDAEAVRRLKAAGAVLLGKLNMHEFAYGGTSAVSFFGPVHNPWAPDYISGGSSGGSAAAVSACMCYAALGSDTGGSIREPSSYCGTVGLKPTYGRVSLRGVIPLSWSLDHIGPIARTAADSAVVLQVIAGYDPEDPTSIDAPVPDYVAGMRHSSGMPRLGIPRKPFYTALDPDVERAMNEALSELKKLSSSIQDVELPPIHPASGVILRAEAYAYHRPYVTKTPDLYQPDTLRRVQSGANVSAADYIIGRRELERTRRAVKNTFTTIDLLITPTSPVLPELIDKPDGQDGLRLRNTSPFDSYGLPTISIPCGFSSSGLPIGLQISGPPWGEVAVLQLARAYENATEWNRRMRKVAVS